VVAKIQEDLDRKKYDIGLLNTKIKDLKAGYK